jgi:hypothetical protein
MIVESGDLPDKPGSSLAPDVLTIPECMPAADENAAGTTAAVQQHGGQLAEVPEAAGASTADAIPPPALEQHAPAEHDELQDLLQ